MSTPPTECLRCRGHMETGLMLDYAHGGIVEPQWMDGPAERSIWTGVKTKGHVRYRVTTYRCERCGYLESYANDEITK